MTETVAPFDVALCQYELRGVDGVDELLDRTAGLFDRAGPAELYVLPELFVTDQVDSPDASIEATALTPGQRDELHRFLRKTATGQDAVVVGGSYNIVDDGGVVNRCPIALPDGKLRTYDKRHPTPEERASGKRAGARQPPIVEHRGVGIGVIICYDVEFPETVRQVTNDGAEVIVVPSWTGTAAGYQRVRRCCAARAVENQAYVVYVPLVGQHLGEAWSATGRGAVFAPCDDIVGPHGTRLSLSRDAHTAGTCQLDLTALRDSRRTAAVRPYADYREGRGNLPAR